MKIIITVNEDNAAFEDSKETTRILKRFAAQFDDFRRGDRSRLMDVNGNAVGTVEIFED